MKTNDIKKGMRVQLRNGWTGVMQDNMKGNTRLVEVNGVYRETGSVYATDIMRVQVDDRAAWVNVEHTPAQLKAAEARKRFGF